MQYILSEEEYKKLIPKDQVKKPIDEFITSLFNAANTDSYMGTTNINVNEFKSLIEKLHTKLNF